MVKPEKNGFLLSPAVTPGEMKNELEKFFALSLPERELLSRGATKTWAEEFDASKNYQDFIKDLKSEFSEPRTYQKKN